MLHLLKYSFLSKVRNFNIIFWPLVFPLVLGTFFYFAFGNINEADFQTVGGSCEERYCRYVFPDLS